MTTSDLLITFASWEERFRIGFDRNLEKVGVRKTLVFLFLQLCRSHASKSTDG